jgi:hypothetical protein
MTRVLKLTHGRLVTDYTTLSVSYSLQVRTSDAAENVAPKMKENEVQLYDFFLHIFTLWLFVLRFPLYFSGSRGRNRLSFIQRRALQGGNSVNELSHPLMV